MYTLRGDNKRSPTPPPQYQTRSPTCKLSYMGCSSFSGLKVVYHSGERIIFVDRLEGVQNEMPSVLRIEWRSTLSRFRADLGLLCPTNGFCKWGRKFPVCGCPYHVSSTVGGLCWGPLLFGNAHR